MDLGDMLATATVAELRTLREQVVREGVIKEIMAETGEPREIVVEMVGAAEAISAETVLELTGGDPTTLRDALESYEETLSQAGREDETVAAADVCAALSALLAHRWPEDDYRPVSAEMEASAEAMAQEIHSSYVKLAPRFRAEVTAWGDLEDYQRGLAIAVVRDALQRGVFQTPDGRLVTAEECCGQD